MWSSVANKIDATADASHQRVLYRAHDILVLYSPAICMSRTTITRACRITFQILFSWGFLAFSRTCAQVSSTEISIYTIQSYRYGIRSFIHFYFISAASFITLLLPTDLN